MRFYENNPTYFAKRQVDWETGTPESRGLSRQRILKLAESLGRRKQAFSLLVARGGVLIWEQYFNGSASFHSNNIHSASKTILSALVGIAQKNGRLKIDQPISDFLPTEYAKGPAGSIAIRHLLTMTSGVRWAEDETEYEIETEPDWIRAILELKADAPGRRFNYSTGNTHLLSTVLSKAAGMPVSDFAQTYLLRPLGISIEHWGRDPQGNDSGGCNVYMTPQCLAKLGQLFLNQGRWRGKAVVPGDWITESWKAHRSDALRFDYGYLCWLYNGRKQKPLVMWGHGGQFVIVIPDLDLVAVMTHDTCDGHASLTQADERALLKRLIEGLASAVD